MSYIELPSGSPALLADALFVPKNIPRSTHCLRGTQLTVLCRGNKSITEKGLQHFWAPPFDEVQSATLREREASFDLTSSRLCQISGI